MTPRALLATSSIAIALLVTGCSTPETAMSGSSDAMSASPTAMMSDAMSPSPTAMMTDAMSAHGNYVTQAQYTAAMSQYTDTKVVYFFFASWCPECQASDKALTSTPGAIPAGVTLVKVDYDNSTALKQKYGVTIHDTFVQVDKNETKVMAWVGQTAETVLAALKG